MQDAPVKTPELEVIDLVTKQCRVLRGNRLRPELAPPASEIEQFLIQLKRLRAAGQEVDLIHLLPELAPA